MSLIKFIQGNVNDLPSSAESEAIYFTRDECIYLGLTDGTYKKYGNYTTVDTSNNLPVSALDGVLFYVKDENALYNYDVDNSSWKQITVDTSKTYTFSSDKNGNLTIIEKDSDGVELGTVTVQIVDVAEIDAKIDDAKESISSISMQLSVTQNTAMGADSLAQAAQTSAKNANDRLDNLGTLAALDEVTSDVVSDDLMQKINESGHTHTNLAELEKISEGDIDKWNAADPTIVYSIESGSSNGMVKLVGKDMDGNVVSTQEVQVVSVGDGGGIEVVPDEAKGITWGNF